MYASWGKRFLAYLIDYAIVVVPVIILNTIGASIAAGADSATLGSLFGLIAAAVGLGAWIYNRGILAGGTGQSIGRKVIGVRLVSEATGQPLGTGMALVRDLAHIADAVPCYIGFLFPLWDAKKQTFADKIMKTVVNEA
jgi:uncharacterized RDD family membrane protein YckC